MPLDHSKATVTVSVAGLALSCINPLKQSRCEVGLLRCDRHRPVLDIQRIELRHEDGEPKCSSLIYHSLNLNEDILINVEHPDKGRISDCKKGTSTYIRRGFDRLSDMGDPEDFRWIADLEGPEFHNRKLIINHSKLKPTIFISDGVLYTRQKTAETLARVSTNGKLSPFPLGKFAYGMNVDISCPKGGEVVLSNHSDGRTSETGDHCSVRLPQDDFVRYLITIENHCRVADEMEGTDFRLFYEAIKDPTGKKFDLRRMVETGCYGEPDAIDAQMDYVLDGYPEKCMTGNLSISNLDSDHKPEPKIGEQP